MFTRDFFLYAIIYTIDMAEDGDSSFEFEFDGGTFADTDFCTLPWDDEWNRNGNAVLKSKIVLSSPGMCLYVSDVCEVTLKDVVWSAINNKRAIRDVRGKLNAAIPGIIRAVTQMWVAGWRHGDIKYDNIMYCDGEWKLIDYEDAAKFEFVPGEDEEEMESRTRTLRFLATDVDFYRELDQKFDIRPFIDEYRNIAEFENDDVELSKQMSKRVGLERAIEKGVFVAACDRKADGEKKHLRITCKKLRSIDEESDSEGEWAANSWESDDYDSFISGVRGGYEIVDFLPGNVNQFKEIVDAANRLREVDASESFSFSQPEDEREECKKICAWVILGLLCSGAQDTENIDPGAETQSLLELVLKRVPEGPFKNTIKSLLELVLEQVPLGLFKNLGTTEGEIYRTHWEILKIVGPGVEIYINDVRGEVT